MRGNSSVGALVIQPRRGPVMLPPQNFVEPKSAHSVTITRQGYFLFFVFFFFYYAALAALEFSMYNRLVFASRVVGLKACVTGTSTTVT